MLRKVKDSIKRYLWSHAPYDKYVKIMYMFSPGFRKYIDEARSWKPRSTVEPGRKLRIVFICTFPQSFNSLKSIYLAAEKDNDIDAYILACPEKIIRKGYVISDDYETTNYAYDMCMEFAPNNTINAYDYSSGTWFDLEHFAPDYVFVARPYDVHMPQCYKSNEMKRYTKICLCIYGYTPCPSDYISVYGIDFIKSLSVIFAESKEIETVLGNVAKSLRLSNLRVRFLGYPRFDLYNNYVGGGTSFRKTILWLPRWDSQNTSFFKYKDTIINYFLEHKDLKLICRPHPLMLKAFFVKGFMTQQEIDSLLNLFAEQENFEFDNNPDYFPALMSSDIFLADYSSLLLEEFITGKPIIYLGNTKGFCREVKRIAELFYRAKNSEQLTINLDKLVDGQDIKQQQRQKYIKEHMNFDHECGERIVNFLKQDYHNPS